MRVTPMADFPLDEYTARIDKLREQMKLAGVDGVMITEHENLRYFTSLRSSDWPAKDLHPGLLLVTSDGRMLMVGQEEYLPTMKASAVLEENEFIGFNSWSSDPFPYPHAVYDAIRQLGLDKGRIGIESGMVMRILMRYTDWFELRRLAGPVVEWVAFAENIWKLRSIKSPREIELFRKLCDISGKCYEKAFSSVVFGKTTERELYHIFSEEAFRLGADAMPPLIVEFGQGRYLQANCTPSDKVIVRKEHEFLFIDTGPSLKGYITDTIRMGVVGSMNPRQKELRQIADDALQFCLDIIKDGIPCYEVSARMDKMVAERGFEPWNQTKGWTGHSLGLEVHEPPTLSCDCDMMLHKNMILSVEPLMMDEQNGMIATEHNVLVTDNGIENLTPWLSDLVIL